MSNNKTLQNMARLVSLNKVPCNGLFIIPTREEVEYFCNRFREVAGFSSPSFRKCYRGIYDRSSKGFYCICGPESSLCLLPSSTIVIFFPHE